MPNDTILQSAPLGMNADTGRVLDGLHPEALQFFQANDNDQAPPEQMLKKVHPVTEHFGPTAEIDPANLHSTGWAVMFSPSATPEIRDALQPLIEHRKKLVDDPQGRIFKTFEGADCCRPDQDAKAWLAARNVAYEEVFPRNGVPYYVMLVGPPEEISFEFQYGLDLYWGVGRVWFPTVQEFRNYAESVVEYETMAAPPTSRQMAVFVPRQDAATITVHDNLAVPMVKPTDAADLPIGEALDYRLRTFLAADATKNSLANIYRGAIDGGSPAVLFTGGHGMEYDSGNERQAPRQGALLCQDWAGPEGTPTNSSQYFQGADLTQLSGAKIHGLVQVTLACYGAGVPEFDNFTRLLKEPKRIAPKPILARLPQTLLGREGGALAMIAHVERAWTDSFAGDRPKSRGLRDVLTLLMRGVRVGHATDTFNTRWAGLSAPLAEMLNTARQGFPVDDGELARLWKARDDARNFIVIGDPAVRLREDKMPVLPA
jgi:Peptidase family C25